jgi:hypothetical protein
MVTENQDSDYYTVEVARDLPLSEQLHKANIKICHDVNANVKVFLEDIQFRNGETNRVEDKVRAKLAISFQPSAISWKLYELRVICLRRHWVITLTLLFVVS